MVEVSKFPAFHIFCFMFLPLSLSDGKQNYIFLPFPKNYLTNVDPEGNLEKQCGTWESANHSSNVQLYCFSSMATCREIFKTDIHGKTCEVGVERWGKGQRTRILETYGNYFNQVYKWVG